MYLSDVIACRGELLCTGLTGRATVFNTGPAAMIANSHAGDIGYVKKGSAIISKTSAHGSAGPRPQVRRVCFHSEFQRPHR
jgi:hypothetical protein